MRVRPIATAVFLYGAVAHADPVSSSEEPKPVIRPEPEPAPCPQPTEPTAADASKGPLPGEESGRIDNSQATDTTGRKVARALLWVPKWLFMAIAWPIGETVYLDARYHPIDWYEDHFYFRDKTIRILPTATFSTGFGLTIGARVEDIDTFGEHETTMVEATTGGQYRLGFRASIDTGRRLGPLRLELSGNFDRRPSEPFYGIGNDGDLVENRQMIDALTDPTAVETHFRYQEARAELLADVVLPHDLRIAGRGSITELHYTPSTTDPSIEDVYLPSTLQGFDEYTRHLYGELEARWDTRRSDSGWEPQTVHGTGSLVLGYAGVDHPFDDGTETFLHYGVELQQYFRLGYGPRVIGLRFHGEAVTGKIEDIPITQLPMLGGGAFLRGYPYARFRDRIAAVASVQYMWSLFQYASAFVFTDVGRVYRDYDNLSLDQLHYGFGIGFEFYTARSFLADVAIASSSDGGVALMAEFHPMLDQRKRWR